MVRSIWMAAAVIAGLAGTTPATAQRVWQGNRWVSMPHRSGPTTMPVSHGQRWQMHNGRWRGGWDAPGGWSNYHRLGRGSRLDRYWMDYRISDYLSFGLAAPPRGYFWVRYYDDAVLADEDGRVWDSVGGIGWNGAVASYDDGYASASAYASSSGTSYAQPIAPVDPNAYYDEAPRDYAPAPAYADPIPYPAPQAGGYPPPPPVQVQTYPGGSYQSGGAFLGGNAYQSGSSYYSSGGYAYGGAGTTTVIINPAPVVTTTTTVTEEVVEEQVVSTSYVRTAPRRVVRKAPVRRYKPRPKCCVCGC